MERVSQQVFRSNDVELRYADAGSDICFVTFTSLGKEHLHGFGERLLEARKISALYFISQWDHWYQPLSVRESLVSALLILRQKRYKRVVTYGASMGGFAAAAFSRALGADVTIMIAPQYSIDPTKPPFEQRWSRESKQIDFVYDDMNKQIRLESQKFLIFDPYSRDRGHADLFAQVPKTELIHVPFGGHLPGRILLRCGLLQDLTLDLATGQFDRQAFYRALHRGRRSAFEYWSTLAEHAQQRRPGRPERKGRTVFALQANKQALKLVPGDVTLLIQAAYLLLRLDRPSEAYEMASVAVTLKPDHPAPWRASSIALRHLGDSRASIEAARQAAGLRSGDADLQRVFVESLLHGKEYRDAVPEAERAVALDPGYAHSYAMLATALKHAGRHREAAEALEKAIARNGSVQGWKTEHDALRAAATAADLAVPTR